MQTSSLTPHNIVKQKKIWIPKININGAKIVKFIKDAYFWEEEHEHKKPSNKTKR